MLRYTYVTIINGQPDVYIEAWIEDKARDAKIEALTATSDGRLILVILVQE